MELLGPLLGPLGPVERLGAVPVPVPGPVPVPVPVHAAAAVGRHPGQRPLRH